MNLFTAPRRVCLAAALAAVLHACGGGGGGGGGSALSEVGITVTSGQLRLLDGSIPPGSVLVALVQRASLDPLQPEDLVAPDQLAIAEPDGSYSFALDGDDPANREFYIYTMSSEHYSRLNDSFTSTSVVPRRSDFDRKNVQSLNGRESRSALQSIIESNRTTVMVAMRDGVSLATDVFSSSDDPGPTVLIRTVYDKDQTSAKALFTLYGYHVVIQDARGRFASEGVDRVFHDDAWGTRPDGFDTVQWIDSLSISNGRVGVLGSSAPAMTGYLAAGAAPPALSCAYLTSSSGRLYDDFFFTSGIFRKNLVEGWLASQGSLYFLTELESHAQRDDWWDGVDITTRFAQMNIPIYHAGSWFDWFVDGALTAFTGLQHDGAPGAQTRQAIQVGPWAHSSERRNIGELEFPPQAAKDPVNRAALQFFDYWLRDADNGFYDGEPVRYYAMGDVDDPAAPGNEWRGAPDWPPPSSPWTLYLQADESLAESAPSDAQTLSYDYDPVNPVPTLGGANFYLPSGPFDQRPLEARPDVLTFTTAVLLDPVEITGEMTAELYISSSAPDTDFLVKIMDVYPDGRSMLIKEGGIRARHHISDRREDLLVPGQVYPVTISLGATSIVFNRGHQIRISVTSSNDPRFDPNPNTGEPFRQHTRLDVATNTVHFAPGAPSQVRLPLVILSGE